MESTLTISPTCLTCGKPLRGRSDKKFCDEGCKNEQNNRLQHEEREAIKAIDRILKHKRQADFYVFCYDYGYLALGEWRCLKKCLLIYIWGSAKYSYWERKKYQLAMHVFLNHELEKINIDESLITGISWAGKQFQDVTMTIDWCGQDDLTQEIDFINSTATLYFEFVTDLEFTFKFNKGTMGALEITSFTFKAAEVLWAIEFTFKFYPVGYFKFNCNNFKFIVDRKPNQV
jgi:hypothetical protein